MKKKIYFRADAGHSIGYGHFIRTLALADMLKDDFDCVFFTQTPTDYQKKEMESVCRYVELPADESSFLIFLEYLTEKEIVVIDNYFYTTDYQTKIKERGSKLVCIDDLHDKHYVADVVINHALTDPLLFDCESYTKLYLGFDYALLREPFLKPVSRCNRKKNIIVCFGGSDYLHIADKVVSMLLNLNVQYNIEVILGDKAQLSDSNMKKVTIKRNLSAQQMAELFEQSAMAILSASTVSIEALSRELPSIIGYYVENQKEYCKKVGRDGQAVSVGNLLNLTEESLAEALNEIKTFTPSFYFSTDIKPRYINLFKQIS